MEPTNGVHEQATNSCCFHFHQSCFTSVQSHHRSLDYLYTQLPVLQQSADAILRRRKHVTSTDDVIPIIDVTMANKVEGGETTEKTS